MDLERLSRLTKQNHKEFSSKSEDEYVVCLFCEMKCVNLSLHCRRVHNNEMPIDKYKEYFPDSPLWPVKKLREMSERVSGAKNPWYNHGGRLSPFSEKSGRSREEIDEFVKKVSETKPHTTRLEYWMSKCENKEEAERALKRRQTTFTLDGVISKYGLVEGVRKYSDRQRRWRETLDSKYSKEELKALQTRGLINAGFFTSGSNKKCELDAYRQEVWKFSNITLKLYRGLTFGLEFGRKKHHIDHILSIKDGFLNGLPACVVGSKCNIRALWWKENCSKREKSDISVEELVENYERFIENDQSKIYREFLGR